VVELSFEGPKEVVISSGLQVGELVVGDNVLLLARQFLLAQEESRVPEKSPVEITPSAAAAKPNESRASQP